MKVKCPNCNSDLFHLHVAPTGSTEQRNFITCAQCGAIVITLERDEIKAISKIRTQLRKQTKP